MKKIILLLILCIAITANAQKAIKGTSKTAFNLNQLTNVVFLLIYLLSLILKMMTETAYWKTKNPQD